MPLPEINFYTNEMKDNLATLLNSVIYNNQSLEEMFKITQPELFQNEKIKPEDKLNAIDQQIDSWQITLGTKIYSKLNETDQQYIHAKFNAFKDLTKSMKKLLGSHGMSENEHTNTCNDIKSAIEIITDSMNDGEYSLNNIMGRYVEDNGYQVLDNPQIAQIYSFSKISNHLDDILDTLQRQTVINEFGEKVQSFKDHNEDLDKTVLNFLGTSNGIDVDFESLQKEMECEKVFLSKAEENLKESADQYFATESFDNFEKSCKDDYLRNGQLLKPGLEKLKDLEKLHLYISESESNLANDLSRIEENQNMLHNSERRLAATEKTIKELGTQLKESQKQKEEFQNTLADRKDDIEIYRRQEEVKQCFDSLRFMRSLPMEDNIFISNYIKEKNDVRPITKKQNDLINKFDHALKSVCDTIPELKDVFQKSLKSNTNVVDEFWVNSMHITDNFRKKYEEDLERVKKSGIPELCEKERELTEKHANIQKEYEKSLNEKEYATHNIETAKKRIDQHKKHRDEILANITEGCKKYGVDVIKNGNFANLKDLGKTVDSLLFKARNTVTTLQNNQMKVIESLKDYGVDGRDPNMSTRIHPFSNMNSSYKIYLDYQKKVQKIDGLIFAKERIGDTCKRVHSECKDLNTEFNNAKEKYGLNDNFAYERFSKRIEEYNNNIMNKSKDPNAVGSDAFENMKLSLKNAEGILNNGYSSKKQKLDALEKIQESAQKYIEAKNQQFRPFPSEQRRARLAFANELRDFANASLSAIKTFDDQKHTLYNDLVNGDITLEKHNTFDERIALHCANDNQMRVIHNGIKYNLKSKIQKCNEIKEQKKEQKNKENKKTEKKEKTVNVK